MSLKTTLYALIKPLIGAEVLNFADQNASPPPLPYWTLKISSYRTVGKDVYSQGVDVDGNQLVSGVREATVQVQRIGEDSDVSCADLCNNLSKTSVREVWRAERISLYDLGDVLNVPYKLENSRVEPRAVVDLLVRFGTELLDHVGGIDTLFVSAGYVTNQTVGFDEPNPDLAGNITVVL